MYHAMKNKNQISRELLRILKIKQQKITLNTPILAKRKCGEIEFIEKNYEILKIMQPEFSLKSGSVLKLKEIFEVLVSDPESVN